SMTVSTSIGKWALDLTSYEAQQLGVETTPEQDRLFMPPRMSVDRGGDVELTVTNELNTVVHLIWIDRSSQPQSYGTIAPGATKTQHTFAGHVWLLKSADDTAVAAFEAVDGQNDIVVSKAALKAMTQQQQVRPSRRQQRPENNSRNATSPNKESSVFVRDHNVWRQDLSGSPAKPQQLSSDGTVENTFQKNASRGRVDQQQDPVADVRWSPDSKFLIAFQTATVPERRVYYVESSPPNQLQPSLESYSYAKPGDAIPIPLPRLFSAV
ncbi:MAG: hypothetical protein GY826_29720, partial [Fuerstiella sp.]|nr:hypothetical protein [Fuerstiella sp.]